MPGSEKHGRGQRGKHWATNQLGGTAAVAEVRTMWPDNDKVQEQVQELAGSRKGDDGLGRSR
jgi:hypothetical protein